MEKLRHTACDCCEVAARVITSAVSSAYERAAKVADAQYVALKMTPEMAACAHDVTFAIPGNKPYVGGDAPLVLQLCRHFLADRDGLIMLVKVYLDEGDIHDDAKVLVVAGYVAKPTQWQAFTKQWNAILKSYGITCYHATDAQSLHGEFEGWSKEKRDELVVKLLPFIPKHALGIAFGIVLKDYEEALAARPDLQGYLPSPYACCFQWLVQTLVSFAHIRQSDTRFAFVHETNNMKREAIEGFNWVKGHLDFRKNLVSLTFADKTQFVPLQAADILAFETQRKLANLDGKERRSFQALNPNGEKLQIGFFGKRNMTKLIEALERVKAFASQRRDA